MENLISYNEMLPYMRKKFSDVTEEEIAIWVWSSVPKKYARKREQLIAYLNPSSTRKLTRNLIVEAGFDDEKPWYFIWQLSECFFKRRDIDQFEPRDRWLTFEQLSERWKKRLAAEIALQDFIVLRAKNDELQPIHPYTGLTPVSVDTLDASLDEALNGTQHWPGLRQAMFRVSEVETVERHYHLESVVQADSQMEGVSSEGMLSKHGEQPGSQTHPMGNSHCAEFREMRNLSADEVSLTLLAGDMLEISARDCTKLVPSGALDLVKRRSHGGENKQGAILVCLARGKRVPRGEVTPKDVSRLRGIFKTHLDVSDPFYPYQTNAGWVPRFSIKDNRSAADERAKRETRHIPIDNIPKDEYPFAAENDPAAEFLKQEDT